MHDVPLWRLYLLRAVYLIIAVGLGVVVWPNVLLHTQSWELMGGVVQCMLAAFGALCLLGVRYPLQMLPVLMWELAWKSIWLLVVALPATLAGSMDPRTAGVMMDCLVAVLIPLAMPWGYVLRHYVRKQGDRWGSAKTAAAV